VGRSNAGLLPTRSTSHKIITTTTTTTTTHTHTTTTTTSSTTQQQLHVHNNNNNDNNDDYTTTTLVFNGWFLTAGFRGPAVFSVEWLEIFYDRFVLDGGLLESRASISIPACSVKK
jgi:hypothetical protein